MDQSIKRHIAKTITWRIVGTLDTMMLGWIVSGDLKIGLSVGGLELLTKMGLYYLHERVWYRSNFGLKKRSSTKKNAAKNLTIQTFSIDKKKRNTQKQHKSFLIWFTGLSGIGKSTLANLLENELHEQGIHTFVLDGDNIRLGLNKDLSFTGEDRSENIRRIGEVANLMIDGGLVTIAAFVSPFEKDRQLVRSIVGPENFIEVYVSTPLDECKRRDVKGLYEKAMKGEIREFTGISSPYEAPKYPDITVDTSNTDADEALDKLLELVLKKLH
jgi:adenylylsulfate kinase